MASDFLLKLGHFEYYGSTSLILFKSVVGPLLTSVWQGKGVATLALPGAGGVRILRWTFADATLAGGGRISPYS